MSDPTDRQRLVLVGLLALWCLAFGWSILAAATTPPSGDGFVKGMNRVTLFLGWQGVAMLLAVAAFGLTRRWPKGSIRRLSAVPFGIALAEIALILAILLWAQFGGR